MPYDENLALLIRQVLVKLGDFEEKKMFGGVGFLFQGNMVCGVHKDMLIVRVGPEANEESLSKPHTKPFDITGKPMKGWVLVNEGGFKRQSDLEGWIERGFTYARTLPPK